MSFAMPKVLAQTLHRSTGKNQGSVQMVQRMALTNAIGNQERQCQELFALDITISNRFKAIKKGS